MENWSVVQTIKMEAAAWQICKDPLGKCLMLASQQQNYIMFFSVDDYEGEDHHQALTIATLLPSPRIFQYADILFRGATGPGGKHLKGYEEVKRVKFAGFSNTGLKFCEVNIRSLIFKVSD